MTWMDGELELDEGSRALTVQVVRLQLLPHPGPHICSAASELIFKEQGLIDQTDSCPDLCIS